MGADWAPPAARGIPPFGATCRRPGALCSNLGFLAEAWMRTGPPLEARRPGAAPPEPHPWPLPAVLPRPWRSMAGDILRTNCAEPAHRRPCSGLTRRQRAVEFLDRPSGLPLAAGEAAAAAWRFRRRSGALPPRRHGAAAAAWQSRSIRHCLAARTGRRAD